MNPDGHCALCEIDVPGPEFHDHLEKFHVGPASVEALQLKCGNCDYFVAIQKVQRMVHHCRILGHQLSGVQLKLDSFLVSENERILTMLSIANDMDSTTVASLNQGYSSRRSAQLKRPAADTTDSRVKVQRTERREQEKILSSGGQEGGEEIAVEKLIKSERFEQTDSESVAQNQSEREQFRHVTSVFNSSRDGEPRTSDNRESHDGSSQAEQPKRKGRRSKVIADEQVPEQCALCPLPFKNWHSAISHALVHDKTIRPFKCSKCDFAVNKRGLIRYGHLKSKKALTMGCTGEYENVQTPEMNKRIKLILKESMPTINWEEICVPGFSADGVEF